MDLTKADIPRGMDLPRGLMEQGTPKDFVPSLEIPYEQLVLQVQNLTARLEICEKAISILKERISENGS